MAIQKTTVNLPQELWQAFKAACAQDGITMTDRLIQLIEADVGKHQPASGVA